MQRISSGSFELNRFLGGGYEKNIITTLYGPGGSGKSNFCMMSAVSAAARGKKVIFIDTEGGFSSERFKQIYQGEKSDEVISNILLLNPTSFEEQEKSFETLLKFIKRQGIDLIIVDSIAMLYRLELADAIRSEDITKIQHVNRKLAGQLRSLNEIARKQGIPVIVTNQVYTQFTEDIEEEKMEHEVSMVGGDLLKYWSKCLIELQVSFGKRKVVLKKHRSLPVKEFPFEIINTGIKKRGLF